MIISFFSCVRSEFVIHKISELKTISFGNPKIPTLKLSSEQKTDENVTRERVTNEATINCYGCFLYLSLLWKK